MSRRDLPPFLGRQLQTPGIVLEGASLDESLVIVEKVIAETAVLCTHGDVIGNLLSHFQRHGSHLDDIRLEKGSMWVLDVVEGAVVAASYVPPPS